jgi:murein DD-endopeptidase MepM/ murein hydrolase activator NlpD
MKHTLLGIAIIPLAVLLPVNLKTGEQDNKKIEYKLTVQDASVSAETVHPEDKYRTIAGVVRPKDTLESIFLKHKLDKVELSDIYRSARKQYDLSRISVGNIDSFEIESESNSIRKMEYGIDNMSYLSVLRGAGGFSAVKVDVPLEKRTGSFFIEITGSLMMSMPGPHKEYNRLALQLSDIYAWDIDFSRDIRDGDSVKILVEELWAGEAFKGFGNILAAEFINDGVIHSAYRFEHDGYADYYDRNGKSLRKSLLRSPLKFKYISSRFSKRRFHPKLKRYRQHLAVDYAASTGTPVSSAGSGKVMFAGYKGQIGKMVRIRHRGGYETYYGHLSKIPSKIKKGKRVSQGDIIGYVGSTGLSTGPHLDYRIKFKGKFVDPLKIRLPRGKSVPGKLMAEFEKAANAFKSRLALLKRQVIASGESKRKAAS